MIPEADRKRMLQLLHNTHLETESMLRLARGKFFWPGMSKDIKEVYKMYKDCKTESIAKIHKKASVIPQDLMMIAPGEHLSMDYATYVGKKYLIIKDVHSGFIDVKWTKNQTTEEAERCVHEWSFTFGLPHHVRTDGGPAFRDKFQKYL